jgi:hypothetical protein
MAEMRSTCGISGSVVSPCSPGDSTISVPQPRIRSSSVLRNETSEIRDSGMSLPLRAMTPVRSRSRLVVSSYCVVRHTSNGYIRKHMSTAMAATASASRSTVALLPAGMSTSPTSTAATRTTARPTGRTSVFQCGCRTSTSSSPTASERSSLIPTS